MKQVLKITGITIAAAVAATLIIISVLGTAVLFTQKGTAFTLYKALNWYNSQITASINIDKIEGSIYDGFYLKKITITPYLLRTLF